MSNTLLIVAIGSDRAGLANELTHEINAAGLTIQQTHMQTLGGHFAMLLAIQGTAEQVEAVRRQAKDWETGLGLDISVYAAGARDRGEIAGRAYSLRVDALERAGIIDDVTRVLRRAGANVSFLEGSLRDMPFSGELRFVLRASAEIPDGAVADVEKALEALDLDYVLGPA